MSDLNAYRHFEHPYTRYVDEYGITIPGCACGERAIPGFPPRCAECLIADERAKASTEAAQAPFSPSYRRFPETPIPTTGAAT